MSRFLFVVPPVAERVRPAVAVGRELAARGHDVAWAGHRGALDDVPLGATVVPVGGAGHDDGVDIAAAHRIGSLRSPGDLLQLWGDFLVPLARTMLPTVRAAVDGFGPDVVVADQQALAGAAVAHRAGLPWATVVPTSAGLADPLADLPKIRQQVRRQVRCFLVEAGLDDVAAARIDPQASPHLVLACTTEALAGPMSDSSSRYELVGPCLDPPLSGTGADRRHLNLTRPLVVLAVEAPHADPGARFQRAAVDAMSSTMAVRTVVVEQSDPPERWRALVRHAAVVICDGGHSTVWAALGSGIPLVVVPLTGDQPLVAEQVVAAAAGIRLPARSVDADLLGRAISTVLADDRIRRGAHRIRDSLVAAPGPAAAAGHLEALLDRPLPSPAELVEPADRSRPAPRSTTHRHRQRHLVAL